MSSDSLSRMKEPAVGLYGKILAERDFVRVNAGDFQQAGLDLWFQQGIECLHAEHTVLPAEAAHFLLVSPSGGAFVGVFVPGEDAVGRHFPLVISVPLEIRNLIETLPLIPSIFAPFFEAATVVAEAARDLSAQDLATQVDWLKQPLDQNAPALPLDSLLGASSFFELRVAIGGLNEGGGYALNTLMTACDQVCAKPPESPKQTVTVECPTPTDGMRAFWLELIRRRLGPGAPTPSFVWTATRMLVALGPAPPLMLAYLANPEHKGSRFWPLHTTNTAASEKAVSGLSPAQSQLLASGGASLAEVLAVFGAR
jgi:type VI secretion system ImpM family protein